MYSLKIAISDEFKQEVEITLPTLSIIEMVTSRKIFPSKIIDQINHLARDSREKEMLKFDMFDLSDLSDLSELSDL